MANKASVPLCGGRQRKGSKNKETIVELVLLTLYHFTTST